MTCQMCQSERLASVVGKTKDLCSIKVKGEYYDGYVPHNMGIGSGDYIEFVYCLDCGQIKGEFPLPETKLERGNEGEPRC